VRAYLGAFARRRENAGHVLPGSNPKDDVELFETSPRGGGRGKPRARRDGGCFHVVNMALNLVSGDELAWQERKAESMTRDLPPMWEPGRRVIPRIVSKNSTKRRSLGYRPANEYGGERRKLTLGTAMAIFRSRGPAPKHGLSLVAGADLPADPL